MGELFPPYNQFDSGNPTNRSDCAPCAALWSLRFATDSNINPQSRAKIDELLHELRHEANPKKAPPAITMREIEHGFESVAASHAKSQPKMRRFSGGSMEDDLWPAISSGSAALVMVNYGVVNHRRPKVSGSRGFKGGHAIAVANGRQTEKGRFVTVADSTRKKLVTWPWWLLVRSAGLYGSNPWGVGRGEFGIVRKPGEPDPGPVHPTPPPDPAKDKIAKLKATIANLREEIEQLKAQLAGSEQENAQLIQTIQRIQELLDKAEAEGSLEALSLAAEEELPAIAGAALEPDDPEDLLNGSDIDQGAAWDDSPEPDATMAAAEALVGVAAALSTVDIEGTTRKELLAQAKKLDIHGRWDMNKRELGEAIARHH
jgi:hypothetical protein